MFDRLRLQNCRKLWHVLHQVFVREHVAGKLWVYVWTEKLDVSGSNFELHVCVLNSYDFSVASKRKYEAALERIGEENATLLRQKPQIAEKRKSAFRLFSELIDCVQG